MAIAIKYIWTFLAFSLFCLEGEHMTMPFFSFPKEKQLILQILLFFLFYFGFHIVNEQLITHIGNPYGEKMHYPLALICIAIGYLLFPFVFKICKKEESRRIIFMIVCFLFLISYTIMVFGYQSIFSLLSSYAATILYGYIGGSIHYSTALAFSGNPFAGRIVGAVTCIAVFFKYFIRQYDELEIIYHFCILALVFLSLYLSFKPTYKWTNRVTSSPIQQTTQSFIAIELIVSTVLMLFIISLNFSIIARQSVDDFKSIPFSAQIFFAIGLFCAGILADIKKRRHFTAITSYALIFMTIVITASTIPELYSIRFFILYFFAGFFVVYLFVAFLDYAPNALNRFGPPLFSSLGRVIQCIGAAGIIIFLKIWKPGETTVILTFSFLLALCILILFLVGNKTNRSAPSQTTTVPTDVPEDVALQNFAESNHFTDRETEVFVILVTTEKTVQEIADNLYISRRVLQRYISSIYKKTDTKTRIGLLQLYHNSKE